MRTFVLFSAIGVVVVAGIIFYGRRDVLFKAEGKLVAYTVIRREITYSPDGTQKVRKDLTEAFRSDGSRVIQLTPLDDVDEIGERQIFFSNGLQITINDRMNLKSTVIFKDVSPKDLQRDPRSNCLNLLNENPLLSKPRGEVIQGEESVSGYRTIKISSGSGITRWFAADYGCACVKDRMDFGEGKGHGEKSLVKLIPGEPEAALFVVPDSMKEVPPSERMKEQFNKNCDAGCSERLAQRLRKMDEQYYKHHPNN